MNRPMSLGPNRDPIYHFYQPQKLFPHKSLSEDDYARGLSRALQGEGRLAGGFYKGVGSLGEGTQYRNGYHYYYSLLLQLGLFFHQPIWRVLSAAIPLAGRPSKRN